MPQKPQCLVNGANVARRTVSMLHLLPNVMFWRHASSVVQLLQMLRMLWLCSGESGCSACAGCLGCSGASDAQVNPIAPGAPAARSRHTGVAACTACRKRRMRIRAWQKGSPCIPPGCSTRTHLPTRWSSRPRPHRLDAMMCDQQRHGDA
eukprot:25410-Chlamydomonas_euryale.AAC.2